MGSEFRYYLLSAERKYVMVSQKVPGMAVLHWLT
jgi:hypothetical protein